MKIEDCKCETEVQYPTICLAGYLTALSTESFHHQKKAHIQTNYIGIAYHETQMKYPSNYLLDHPGPQPQAGILATIY